MEAILKVYFTVTPFHGRCFCLVGACVKLLCLRGAPMLEGRVTECVQYEDLSPQIEAADLGTQAGTTYFPASSSHVAHHIDTALTSTQPEQG